MKYKTISIRKKILLSNFLMVLVPIIFVCFILFIILASFTILTSSNSLMIRNVLLNSSNYGPTLYIKSLNDELASHDNLSSSAKTLINSLEAMNVKLSIKKDGELYYITPSNSQKDIQIEFQQIAQTTSYKTPYIVWNQNGMAYASSLKNTENKQLEVQFCGRELILPQGSYETWEQTKFIIKIGVIVSGTIMIFLIVLLGTILTKKLSRHILLPLKQLQDSTNLITQGDLTTSIQLDCDDELGELGKNFEAMRLELASSKQLQQHYEENRKELIAGITHDLNTPLTSIQGYVSGLLDGIANTPEKQRHYLNTIQEQTKRMEELVESLFLFSKLDLQKEPFENIHLDFVSFLIDFYKEHKAEYELQHTFITLHIEEIKPVYVTIDPMQFHRVIMNLVSNSMKYKKAEDVHIDISLQCDKHQCTLSFQDDGIGIMDSEATKLFDSFYRSDPARSSSIKGNGLGLAIVKQIVQHSNGNIQAVQVQQKGLCILITLPLEEII